MSTILTNNLLRYRVTIFFISFNNIAVAVFNIFFTCCLFLNVRRRALWIWVRLQIQWFLIYIEILGILMQTYFLCLTIMVEKKMVKHTVFNSWNNALSFHLSFFHNQPARTFWDASTNASQCQHSHQPNSEQVPPPPDFPQDQVKQSRDEAPEMPAAVDSDVNSASDFWRQELVDCGEDSSKLAADC